MYKERKNLLKKVISIVMIFIIVFTLCSKVYAAINEEYGNNEPTIELDADSVVKSSTVLNLLGQLVFAVGNLIENATSGIVYLLTGENVFPWADKVIFNTMPILDINFINPDDSSIFSQTYGVGNVIRNIYFTGLSLALGFLGVIIAIMAIKLAISTIASEKAKYKEAIVKWLTAIILLFSMHFVLSFVFYLNEQLVIVASTILSNTLKDSGEELVTAINEKLNSKKEDIVFSFVDQAVQDAAGAAVSGYLNPIVLLVDLGIGLSDLIQGKDNDIDIVAAELLKPENTEIVYAFISNDYFKENYLFHISGNDQKNLGESIWSGLDSFANGLVGINMPQAELNMLYSCVEMVKNPREAEIKNKVTIYDVISNDEVYKEVLAAYNNIINDDSQSKDSKGAAQIMTIILNYSYNYNKDGTVDTAKKAENFISDLGNYFKESAWYTDIENGGWSPSEVSIVAAILYAMFVFQSLMFFIAYFKRLFYVVILAVIAPFVVIYDFFIKSMSL